MNIIIGTYKCVMSLLESSSNEAFLFLKQSHSCKLLLLSDKKEPDMTKGKKGLDDYRLSIYCLQILKEKNISVQGNMLLQEIETLSGMREDPSMKCNIFIIINGFPAGLYEEISRRFEEGANFTCHPFNPDISIKLPMEYWSHKNPAELLDETYMPYKDDLLDGDERWQVRASLISSGSILITGAVGMGKTILAKFIHDHFEPTAGSHFVTINLSGLGEEIAMAALKGTVKGAFTGAENRQGLLRKASGGTLFLDEIAEADTRVQVKLLDIVQPRRIPVKFEKVGSTETETSILRFVAATNMPDIKWAGCFRDDLRSRLPIRIHLKNLYEKKDEQGGNIVFFKRAIKYFTDSYFLGNPIMAPIWDDNSIRKAVNSSLLPDNLRDLKSFVESLLDSLLIEKTIRFGIEKFVIDFKLIRDALLNTKVALYPQNRNEHLILTNQNFLQLIDTLQFGEDDRETFIKSSEKGLQDIIHKLHKIAFEIAIIAANGNEAKARRIIGIRKPELFKRILNDPTRQYFHPLSRKRN